LEKASQNAQDTPQAMMIDGKIYEVTKEEPRLTEKSRWVLIRQKRNQLLAECDWTQIPDVPLDEKQREAWRKYRQALRDIPHRFEKADDVTWPKRSS
jgi:hypothetical protein